MKTPLKKANYSIKSILSSLFFSLFITVSQAQIISQFTWDSNPVTTAAIGPNAISVGSSATSSSGGAGGTNGLNAGLPKRDLNMILADDVIFDVNGMDISFDFQRDESQGTFFRRGSSLIIDGTNQLSVSYRVDNGSGGFTTVNSGNVYSIPNDNTFRTYRFYYLPLTGFGALIVDGVKVWSNDGPDNRNMYWTGAGNLEIGNAMDGSGQNKPFLDNFTIAEVSDAPLPIELLTFQATLVDQQAVQLFWQTASEINNDYFTIERSIDARSWEVAKRINGAGNSTELLEYITVDEQPYEGTSYYRLKQTDYNGEFSYSDIRAVEISPSENTPVVIYPNPSEGMVYIEGDAEELNVLQLFNANGAQLNVEQRKERQQLIKYSIDLSNFETGVYFIRTKTGMHKVLKH